MSLIRMELNCEGKWILRAKVVQLFCILLWSFARSKKVPLCTFFARVEVVSDLKTKDLETVHPFHCISIDVGQRSSTLLLGTHYPEEFSSNPNQHTWSGQSSSSRLLENCRQVCWSQLEINFPGEWVPRSRFEDLWCRAVPPHCISALCIFEISLMRHPFEILGDFVNDVMSWDI